MEPAKKRIKLKTLNPFITCYICGGYLIDATTVTECLHTFCKSCLVQHLEENNSCPKCEQLIHQSHPKNYISFDRSVQDIVIKLVPNLYSSELKRRKDFYASRGSTYDCSNETVFKDLEKTESSALRPELPVESQTASTDASDCHRLDEQVSLFLISYDAESLVPLKRAYLRCSTHATVTHLKKFLSTRLFADVERFREFDILCNEELMGKDHSLKFILRTRWRTKAEPLELRYKRHMDV